MADQSDRLSATGSDAGRGRATACRPLLAVVSTADAAIRRSQYAAALAFGGNATGITASRESQDTPTVLLTTAGSFVPAITRAAYALDVLLGDTGEEPVGGDADLLPNQARALSRAASGALRLTHRALEVHARNVGYDIAPYQPQALVATEAALLDARLDVDDENPSGLNGTIDAGLQNVNLALQALEVNRGAVPGYLASALGSWFALYLVADAVARR